MLAPQNHQKRLRLFRGFQQINYSMSLSGHRYLIYTDVVSQLHPKIMVRGSHGYLSQPSVANRIRAVLLAGIRAAFLWKQVGGSRWQLLFKRGSYLRAADQCLASIRDEDRKSHQPEPDHHWNGVIRHIKKRGLGPVFHCTDIDLD